MGVLLNRRRYMGGVAEDPYPEIRVINDKNYYRYTPREQFVVYSGQGTGGDQINYYHWDETTRYDFNRLWGGAKTYTGPVKDPPDYFDLAYYTATGYIYNKTRGYFLYKGSDVSDDLF